MMAHTPPVRCASAMMCCTSVVLPDASGPKISTTRPRGTPPTPRAMSSAIEPVGIVSTAMRLEASPSRMIAPLPNCFSMCATHGLDRPCLVGWLNDLGFVACCHGVTPRLVVLAGCVEQGEGRRAN